MGRSRRGRGRGAGPVLALVVALVTGLGVTALAGPVGPAAAAQAPTERPRTFVTGWLPYWQPTSAAASVVRHAEVFDEASPFWFDASSATSVVPKASTATLVSVADQLTAAGVPVVPSVTASMDADRFARLLSDPDRRAAHVAALRAVARTYGVAGLDLDYESVNFGSSAAKDVVRSEYPVLVRELERALQADGRLLSVTVPARRSDADPNWWVYDYAALGAAADRLRVMTYDFSWSGGPAGPIAPAWWVDDVIGYAVSRVDPLKVSIGVPAYGRDWFVRAVSGRCPAAAKETTSLTTSGMQALAASRGITPRWDRDSASRTFTYRQRYDTATGSCTAKRRVWYDDARSLQAKLRLVTRHQVRGVAIWALGNETPGFWSRAARYQQAHPVLLPVLTSTVPARLVYGQAGQVRGVLRAGGAPLAGVRVTLQRRPLDGGRWSGVGSAATGTRGGVTFTVDPRAHREYRLVAARSWTATGATGATGTTRVGYAVSLTDPVPARSGGGSLVLGGQVGPSLSGVTVVKQRLVGGRWDSRGSQVVGADGRFSFVVRANGSAEGTFRVVAEAGALDRGVSAPVRLSFR